jgi:hypothetical protein
MKILERYKKFINIIDREYEQRILDYNEDEDTPFEIRIELSKSDVKTFIKYYNLTCLYEYLEDAVMLTPKGTPAYKQYHRDYCRVIEVLEREKRLFYEKMSKAFAEHTVSIYDCEDEGIGYSECDLMTQWADEVENQIRKAWK